MKLSVIIPAYNEESTIKEIISRLYKTGLVYEIVVVNDCSSDNTAKILASIQKNVNFSKTIKIINHSKNLGKGAAIRSGLVIASGDYVLIQDADLEYDPQDIAKLLKPIHDGKAEVVFGSRFTGEHRNLLFWHMMANKFLTFLTNILYDTTLSDMETCYKIIPLPLIKQLNLKSNKFDFEPEVTAKILKRKIRIYEVPISYAGREYTEGKKITARDGLMAVFTIIKYRLVD